MCVCACVHVGEHVRVCAFVCVCAYLYRPINTQHNNIHCHHTPTGVIYLKSMARFA